MPPLSPPNHRLEKLFYRRKCWMLAELAQTLDYALITVRRRLHQIGYFRSYTHNGKWYTLRASPQFNRQGLWHYRGKGFSQTGQSHGDDHPSGRTQSRRAFGPRAGRRAPT